MMTYKYDWCSNIIRGNDNPMIGADVSYDVASNRTDVNLRLAIDGLMTVDDVKSLMRDAVTQFFRNTYHKPTPRITNELAIDRVIYDGPATIVFWKDGTKTVVKCHGDDVFSERVGLLMCIAKRAYGDKGAFNDVLDEHSADDTQKTNSWASVIRDLFGDEVMLP